MEAIITVVGFLGAGKTTLLKHLMSGFIDQAWNPYIILNDYENAYLDSQQFTAYLDKENVKALHGSCICCSGIHELRNLVNRIPIRNKGITLIEANGTSDACSLMSFLGVGLNERFLPPIQIAVVAVKHWQKRKEYNTLEANQIQVSTLIVLTHFENESKERIAFVKEELSKLNPLAKISTLDALVLTLLPTLKPSENKFEKMDHLKAHWSSASTDLPTLPDEHHIYKICNFIPSSILRIKGCVQIEGCDGYTYFERTPEGQISTRPFRGIPITGTKIITIGPGSSPQILEQAIQQSFYISTP